MGGIGDLLTMTPGIHALRKKYPGKEIHFAIPKRYFSVFANNPDVKLIDIEKDDFDYRDYQKWFNLTDCPAARVESLTAPRVKRSRVDIFARALGIRGMRFRRMDRRPRYFLAEEEKAFRESFWWEHGLIGQPVVGVQLHADETYRDYPYMEQLVEKISRRYKVLVFDAKPIEGYDFENVIKVDSYSIRQAFALAGGCDMIIAPDSAFLHLSAAFNIPCVGLFGPIDGRVRTKDYPLCEYLDARGSLNCVACWRNETIPCKLTNMRTSVCMGHIPVARILKAVNRTLSERKKDACFEQSM
jgi:ADP-heptose:LPS heptosyltransferase